MTAPDLATFGELLRAAVAEIAPHRPPGPWLVLATEDDEAAVAPPRHIQRRAAVPRLTAHGSTPIGAQYDTITGGGWKPMIVAPRWSDAVIVARIAASHFFMTSA